MARKSASLSKHGRFTLSPAQPAPLAAPVSSPLRSGLEVTLLLRRRAPLPSLEAHARSEPDRRPYLSHAALLEKHGALEADLEAVRAFAAEHGLTVVEEDARLQALSGAVRVAGSLRDVARAFDVEDLRWFEHASGRRFVSHEGEVRLPRALRGIVQGVLGLDERLPVERLVAARRPKAAGARRSARASEKAEAPGRAFTVPEIARLYDFPTGKGEGQCIGAIELWGGFDPKDMRRYFESTPGTKKRAAPDIVVVGKNAPDVDAISDLEVTMDTQIIGALCSRARVVVYLPATTPSPQEGPGLKTFFDVLRAAIFDERNRPSVLSVSWGFSENTSGLRGDLLEAFDRLLQAAAHLGITVCAASGDQGSFAPPLESDSNEAWNPAVLFIASNPHVLACGGTTLRGRGGRIDSEVVWNRLGVVTRIEASTRTRSPRTSVMMRGMASGGGVSRLYERPTFQSGAGVPPAASYLWNDGGFSAEAPFQGRGVPDVAAVADLLTGVRIVFQGREAVGGGTSAAAPLWASLVLLLNETLSRELGRDIRLGWLNPLLYRLQLDEDADVLRPITQGSNGGFEASPERPWNACTGLGSPRGQKLQAALATRLRSARRKPGRAR